MVAAVSRLRSRADGAEPARRSQLRHEFFVDALLREERIALGLVEPAGASGVVA
jgi:hypothetical protein